MKKIVFFSKNLNIGGMEKSLINLLNNLVNFYNVTLVLEENTGILKKELDKRITIQEYKLSNNRIVIIRKIINFSKRINWYLKNKNKFDFSCNYATYSIIGSRLAQMSSNNCYLYVHSDYTKVFEGNEDTINFFNQHKINNYKGLIFVANEAKDNFLKVIDYKKVYVINNIIDYKNIINLSKKKTVNKIDNKKKSFLFVGRLDNTSKNFELLLNSFSKVKDDSNLYIIGDGYYKEEIIKLIKKHKLTNRVFLLGEQQNPYSYMRECDCLILTSRYEGFPVIYLEALVLNKKMITTVPVSDEKIDIRKYFKCVSSNEKDISSAMNSINKSEKIDYKINFQGINRNIINEIMNLIEMR